MVAVVGVVAGEEKSEVEGGVSAVVSVVAGEEKSEVEGGAVAVVVGERWSCCSVLGVGGR